MKNIGRYIEQINASKTPEEAFDGFCLIMGKYGYDKIAYSLVTDHPTLNLPKQHGLATSYPEDWMNFYKEKDYMKIDPVTRRVLTSRKPFFWSEVTRDPSIASPSLQLMNEAQDAGVCDGIGISLCSHAGELVGIGLAKSMPDKETNFDFLASAYLLSVYFHETYRDMVAKPRKIELTARETEILCWAAEGKADEDISMILGISLNTIRFHWKNIFNKLEARGRVYAITKAIRQNLITPDFIETTYQKR